MKTKNEFLLDEMLAHGLTEDEAFKYLEFHERCNFESIVRKWRDYADSEQKDYEAEAHYRKTYSPNEAIKDCYEIARQNRIKQQGLQANTLF